MDTQVKTPAELIIDWMADEQHKLEPLRQQLDAVMEYCASLEEATQKYVCEHLLLHFTLRNDTRGSMAVTDRLLRLSIIGLQSPERGALLMRMSVLAEWHAGLAKSVYGVTADQLAESASWILSQQERFRLRGEYVRLYFSD